MGQAKNRKQKIEAMRDALTADEKIVFDLSRTIFERIILGMDMTGGCYRITFLIKALLQKEFSIEADAVVGFINDGTDEVMISHAWLEFKGRKVDLTLANVDEGLNRGPLVILDHRFREHGAVDYSYHRERSEQATAAIKHLVMSDHPHAEILGHKEREHVAMRELSKSIEDVLAFLDNAPDGLTYERCRDYLK